MHDAIKKETLNQDTMISNGWEREEGNMGVFYRKILKSRVHDLLVFEEVNDEPDVKFTGGIGYEMSLFEDGVIEKSGTMTTLSAVEELFADMI